MHRASAYMNTIGALPFQVSLVTRRVVHVVSRLFPASSYEPTITCVSSQLLGITTSLNLPVQSSDVIIPFQWHLNASGPFLLSRPPPYHHGRHRALTAAMQWMLMSIAAWKLIPCIFQAVH